VKDVWAEYSMFVVIFECYFSKHSYIIKMLKRQCSTIESLRSRTSKINVAESVMGVYKIIDV